MTARSARTTLAPRTTPDRLQTLADLFEGLFLDLDRDEGSPPHLLGVAFDEDLHDDDGDDGVDTDDDDHQPLKDIVGAHEPCQVPVVTRARTDDGTDVSLFFKALDGHPAEELLGWRAPDHWRCLGIATGGWASTFDPATRQRRPPRPSPVDRRRVRLLHLVTRDGEAVNVLCQQDAETLRSRWHGPDTGRAGTIDDCLRRALGLPTAPPPDRTLECWTLLWVDRLLALATRGVLEHATWPDLVALHPTGLLVGDTGDAALQGWVVDHLPRAGEMLADGYPWERFKRWCTTDDGPRLGLPSDVLEWMDLGMFARTVLSMLPPLDEALRDLADLLDPDAHAKLVAAVDAWGLLGEP